MSCMRNLRAGFYVVAGNSGSSRVGWEVIRAHEILAGRVPDTEAQASQEADAAARNRTASCGWQRERKLKPIERDDGDELTVKSDRLQHAAECERALQLASDPEHRHVFQRLKAVCLGLAREQRIDTRRCRRTLPPSSACTRRSRRRRHACRLPKKSGSAATL